MPQLQDWLVEPFLIAAHISDSRGWSYEERSESDVILDTESEAVALQRDRRIVIGGTMTITIPANVTITRHGSSLDLRPRLESPYREEAEQRALQDIFVRHNRQRFLREGKLYKLPIKASIAATGN